MYTELGGAGALLLMLGILLRNQSSNIQKMMPRSECGKMEDHVVKEFERGSKKFDKIEENVGEIKVLLARIDERTESISKRLNHVEDGT